MLRLIEAITRNVGDYTIGTLIVMFHIATAERTTRDAAQHG